jgi:ketosteroid isomerase-like protein
MLDMKKVFLLLIVFLIIRPAFSQKVEEDQIHTLLNKQVQSWNCGDLNGFMKGYWESDSLMFIGKKGVTYGYEQTLANYRKNYPDMDQMGELKFDLIKIDLLSSDAAFVIGKWSLKREKAGDVSGHFSLLFKKIKGQWMIVSDHSS